MTTENIHRAPSGVPAGGQFATTPRAGNDVFLHASDDGGLVSVVHPSGAMVNVYVGEDGAIVVDFLTDGLPSGQRVRVNVNDGAVYDGDPEVDEAPGAVDLEPTTAEQIAEHEQAVTAEVLNQYPTATSWEVATEEWDDGFYYSNSVAVTFTTDSGEVARGWADVYDAATDDLTGLSSFDGTGRHTTRKCTIPTEA
jgi:hypothetical protein